MHEVDQTENVTFSVKEKPIRKKRRNEVKKESSSSSSEEVEIIKVKMDKFKEKVVQVKNVKEKIPYVQNVAQTKQVSPKKRTLVKNQVKKADKVINLEKALEK